MVLNQMMVLAATAGNSGAGGIPSISPSSSGLPGIPTITGFLGGLEMWGGLAALGGLLLGVIVWAVASHSHHSELAHSGRKAVLVSLAAGVLVSAGPGLINFFMKAGTSVH